MTIEQKALKTWGEAQDCAMGIWILKDGTIVNGCMGGYVRDVDHAEIGQFFKPSIHQDPGSNYIYVQKFVARGNIRMSMHNTACFQLRRIPTPAQWRALGRCFRTARRLDLDIMIERTVGSVRARGSTGKSYTREEYIEYLARYAPHLIQKGGAAA